MVKIIVAKDKIDCENLLGKFIDESHYDILIEEDTDCYMPAGCGIDLTVDCNPGDDCVNCTRAEGYSEARLAFKFRKNFFNKKEQEDAYIGLREAATQSQNRGLAAGPRGALLGQDGRQGRDWVTDYELEVLEYFMRPDSVLYDDNSLEKIRNYYKNHKNDNETRGQVWLRSKIVPLYPEYHGWFDKWANGLHNLSREEQYKEAEKVLSYISDTTYAQSVYSGVAGWYDRYPRIPFGRETSYTENNYDKFTLSFPFLQSLNRGYKELSPKRWEKQKEAADKIDPKFLVPDTVFTTITVNKSFRTACHRDAGDLNEGISNLLVLSNNGNYSGGYLVFPEYRVAVNVRPGDLLIVNNHEIIHGNTEIVLNDDIAERISIVCYFRENMLELGSYDYEKYRKLFIETRKKNKDHELYRPLWNGVSPDCWMSEEWYNFLKQHPQGDEWLKKYDSDLLDKFESINLESFF